MSYGPSTAASSVLGVEMEEPTPESSVRVDCSPVTPAELLTDLARWLPRDIEDVIVDLADGRITHLMVSYGDWLNSNSVMIPWHALSLDAERECFVLYAAAPQFARDVPATIEAA
jgi:hypothetical protein